MNLIEPLISLIAPHNCIVCDAEGSLLCEGCLNTELTSAVSRCYRCHKVSSGHSVCKSCKQSVPLSHVWATTDYAEISKKLVYKFKFERAIEAAVPIGKKIDQIIPILPQDTIICHIPTANNRIRVRGYDQAEEIAKYLAKSRGYRIKSLLVRTGKSRQVGSGRSTRFQQLEAAFKVADPKLVKDNQILLVDDITTTGATLESAAKILKKSGAKAINAAVFAQA